MSRTYKKGYSKSKRFDSSCRNHGDCPWCASNRTVGRQRQESQVKSELAAWVEFCEKSGAKRVEF